MFSFCCYVCFHCSAVQYAGFTLTPILGALVSAAGGASARTVVLGVPLNKYSTPALVLGGFALTTAVLLFALFVEIPRDMQGEGGSGLSQKSATEEKVLPSLPTIVKSVFHSEQSLVIITVCCS